MRLRIGLDFDNTIANYDEAFPHVARMSGMDTRTTSKRDLKAELSASQNDDDAWQQVQGLVYGKFIYLASLNKGVLEFVLRARACGSEIYIVSHKTEFGHYDESRTSLWDSATNWLVNHNLVGDGGHQIPLENVFYLPTRQAKIEKIEELGLDLFIDDLAEVLNDSLFPKSTDRILFTSNADSVTELASMHSWHDIADEVFGELDSHAVMFSLVHLWPDLNCRSATRVEGRGNSKIFRIDSDSGAMALKVYPDGSYDSLPRRQTEWEALKFLHAHNFAVPESIQTNQELNWSLIEWITGESISALDDVGLKLSSKFVLDLAELSHISKFDHEFEQATEACLAPIEVERQIRSRISVLGSIDNLDLRAFLDGELKSKLDSSIGRAKSLLGESYDQTIELKSRILSPSDFGLHNAISRSTSEIVFFDFEYFGWDDPVKLTADVCLHPGMALGRKEQKEWINDMQAIFQSDLGFRVRLNALFPLYAIRWCLIILNEFRHDKIKNRLNAIGRMPDEIRAMQVRQLEKAMLMLKNIDGPVLDVP